MFNLEALDEKSKAESLYNNVQPDQYICLFFASRDVTFMSNKRQQKNHSGQSH